jgi:acyl-CoA thioesterase
LNTTTAKLAAVPFFGIAPGTSPGQFVVPVTRGLSSGTGALFGGAALGIATAVLEAVAERPLVWVTTQFVHHVRPPAVLDIEVELVAVGRRATQGRVRALHDGNEIFTTVGTVGERTSGAEGDGRDDGGALVDDAAFFGGPPDVPPPDRCPPRPVMPKHRGAFMERTEARLARTWALERGERSPDGHSAMWVRVPQLEQGAATLAVIGDYVPFGLRQALGEGWATHSLDNSLRVVDADFDGWVLADIALRAVRGGFGYGRVDMWSENGRLLATAAQSVTCRRAAGRDP